MNIKSEHMSFKLSNRLVVNITNNGDMSFKLSGKDYEIYYGISSDDILDYSTSENLDSLFDYINREINYYKIYRGVEIKPLTSSEIKQIKQIYSDNISNARHHDYYDAYDNTWKDYED